MQDKIVLKKIVSLTLSFAFLVMSSTGIMLYIVPQGKIAYWADWKMLGLTKTQYGDIHITSMFLFITITIWHIYYNWKPLVSYIKNTSKQITLFKTELLIALSVNMLFVLGTLLNLQPFQSALDLNKNIKSYWEKTYGSPPYGHAEESSLKAFAQHIGVDVTQAEMLLKEKNILLASNTQTLKDIAAKNGVSPQILYDTIRPKNTAQSKDKEVTSLGKRTLGELADMQKISLEKSLSYLKEQGFEATQQSTMREVANALNETPYEIFTRLKTL